jgi:hypothetical protein
MATASSGAFETSAYDAAGSLYPNRIRIEWSSSQSVANNTSTIYWTVKSAGGSGNSYHYVMTGPVTVNIAGTTVYSRSDRFEMHVGETLGSGSFTLTHNSSGSATLTAWAEAAIYTYAVSSTRYSYSVDLPQIPRASSISANGTTMGSPMNIQISKAVSSFTHTIYWYFGNASGTIASQTSSSSVAWTPPLDLANQIPNATSGTGTLKCITYNGGTNIGEKSINFTLTVPSNIVPSINSFNSSIASTRPSGCGLYVKNNSTVKWTASVSGAYGSWISKCTISGPNLSYESNSSSGSYSATSSTLTTYGSKEYTVTIIDSRGRTVSMKRSIYVEDYNSPILTSYNSYRSNADGSINSAGEYVTHKLTSSFYTLGGKNNIRIDVYSKEGGTNSYGNLVIIKNDSNNTISYTYTYASNSFDTSKIYEFKFDIYDSVGGHDTKYTRVGTKNIPFNIAKNNNSAAIGGFAQNSNSGRFDCFWETHLASAPIINSDKKIKRNIEDIDIDVIDSLRPVQYKLINEDSGTTHYGFIAQDVEQALAKAGAANDRLGVVRYDVDKETNERINYAIAYDEIIPLLVKKCQELQQEINRLKGE